ncbi:hypothetical protein ACFXJ8_00015 [Nonomuraea sp. NPDC059194]|uniref:hypothetical protein n=1 Tax=Nonomuraea sp. NPDC059194 TaxID=3346764 RepID=UPI003684FB43
MLHRKQPRHAGLDTRQLRLGATAAVTALILSAVALTRTERGVQLLNGGLGFLEFYVGVFALVTLTATVALGLVTTERVFLSAPDRIRAQLAHRVAAAAGMAFLLVHAALKTSSPTGLAALALFALATTTGVARGRFALTSRPWLWRALHGTAYLAWPVAILHGLTAGRTPAGWVAWSYVVCLAAVVSALLVRAVATLRRPPAVPETVAVAEPVVVGEPARGELISLDDLRRRKAG